MTIIFLFKLVLRLIMALKANNNKNKDQKN